MGGASSSHVWLNMRFTLSRDPFFEARRKRGKVLWKPPVKPSEHAPAGTRAAEWRPVSWEFEQLLKSIPRENCKKRGIVFLVNSETHPCTSYVIRFKLRDDPIIHDDPMLNRGWTVSTYWVSCGPRDPRAPKEAILSVPESLKNPDQ